MKIIPKTKDEKSAAGLFVFIIFSVLTQNSIIHKLSWTICHFNYKSIKYVNHFVFNRNSLKFAYNIPSEYSPVCVCVCVRLRACAQYDEETGTPDSTKDSTEMLRGVTYRPPSSGGSGAAAAAAAAAASSYRPRQKSVNCLGGCSDRKGSSVSIAYRTQ